MYKQKLNPYDKSIPGYTEISGWPKEPVVPEKIVGIYIYRDGGTVGFSIGGRKGKDIEFFFDRVLGRLCYGEYETKNDAAFIKKNSGFEKELFQYIEKARKNLDIKDFQKSEITTFNACFKKSKTYSGV